MEFSIPRNDLAVAVTHAVHGVPNNPFQPVRAGMRVETLKSSVSFTGSDGDVAFTAVTHIGPVYPSGSVTVPGKLFADIVKTLPDDNIHFVTDDITATLTCGRIQFKFPLYKEDYPGFPEIVSGSGEIESSVFCEGIRKVIPAASRSDSNPALASVYLEPAGDTLWGVCTDRYRLAAVQMTWSPLEVLQPVLVPSWAAEKWTRSAEGPMTLGWDDRVITFNSSNLTVTSRITGAEFPKQWRNMLPPETPSVEVSTEDLQAALKRAQLASEADSPVELTFSHGRLRVEAGYGNHADDVLDATYTGEDFKVLFGIGYLNDGLAGCGPVTCFGWTDPNAPVWLTSGSYTYTVLPRRRL
jgi:DNA polymerase III subunit beta